MVHPAEATIATVPPDAAIVHRAEVMAREAMGQLARAAMEDILARPST
jgi:hypothetical protein